MKKQNDNISNRSYFLYAHLLKEDYQTLPLDIIECEGSKDCYDLYNREGGCLTGFEPFCGYNDICECQELVVE